MTFSNDTQQTDVTRLARHLVLATLLAAPIPSYAALQTPRRPASIEAVQSSPASRQATHQRNNRSYLAMVGPAALTFAEAEIVLPAEPVMPDPPKPKPDLTKIKPANDSSAVIPLDSAAFKPATETPDSNIQPNNNGAKPISILPDDTRREIRAEDVLPYFQFPSGAGDSGPAAIAIPVTINPPQTPAAAPPSTATYRQQ